jgi:eukaryotic-like serine/threonine-protein kinase
MPLSAGTRVAHFEVAKAIGAGAMGEVYRARDLALGRAVALKVLPDDVAGDPVRLARFEREARAAAALNHPNILVVFEVGVTDPVPYVAAELLDGRTLAEAMRQPLGIKRAADYAAQVARGLAAAHDKGVIHRDIKPANLFVTTDGVVKILDFGIAKVTGDQVSTATMTLEGTVIGTAPYMAPEQVRGAAVDGRTDLFALGAVCYEMLAGRRAFLGDSTAEILSAVLQQDPPDLHTLVPAVPPGLARVVHRCLEKDPVARFQSARDLAFALETAMQPDGTVAPSGFGRRGLAALAAVLVAGLVVGGIIGGRLNRDGAEPTFARHLSVGPPAATPLSPDIYVPFALSPDGTTLVFADRQDQRLFVRRLDTFAISPVPGAEAAYDPFFSPDGRWIGFWSHGEIKKVPLAGGATVVVCQALDMLGASWGDDGAIVFSTGLGQGLSVVSSEGGTPRALTTLDAGRGELLHAFPQVLSGGRGVLFTAQSRMRDAPYSVDLYDPRGGARRQLVNGARYGRFLPSGHLAFVRQRALVAVKTAAGTVDPAGTPVTLVDDVQTVSPGGALFAIADEGTLAFVPFRPQAPKRLLWVDRSGAATDTGLPARAYFAPRLSPDGRRAAVRVSEAPAMDLWIATFARSTLERLTFDRTVEYTFSSHSFSPDGAALAYSADGPDGAVVTVQGLGGQPRALLTWPRRIAPTRVTRHGLLLVELGATTGGDLLLLPPGSAQPQPVVQRPGHQWGGAVSPDERFVAFAGDESGRNEIYVQPFPGPGPKRQLTSDGGTEAVWSRDGREIFYRSSGRMMAIPVTASGTLVAGQPRPLFDDRFAQGSPGEAAYDVGPDGRFLMLESDVATPPRELRVVLNWLDDVKRRVP